MDLSEFVAGQPVATITLAQTTYLHLSTAAGAFRVDFRRKAAAYLKPRKQGIVQLLPHHPLLLWYNEWRATLYINSRPADPQALFTDLEQALTSLLQGGYDWRTTLFGRNQAGAAALLLQNLTHGSGILLDRAPVSAIRTVVAICEQHGVATKAFGLPTPDQAPPPLYTLLLIGPCYVVAQAFSIRPL